MNAVETPNRLDLVIATANNAAGAVMKSLDDLPDRFTLCLTEAEIPLTEGARREMALLQGDSGTLLVLAEQLSQAGSRNLRDLRNRAAQRGYPVGAERRAVPGLIPLIYQHFATPGDKAGTAVDSRAQRAFDNLVFQAGESNASDIHIIIRPPAAEIKFRIYGELETIAHWTSEHATDMCTCAYTVLAEIRDTTWVPERPQDANFARVIRGRLHRIRYSHKPIYPLGVLVVLRILSTGKGFAFAPSLQHLGYSEGQAQAIQAMVAEPNGALVVSGETGSGKSTTLANLMNLLLQSAGGSVSLQTVEDPPEYEVPGAIQSPVIHSRDDRDRGIDPYVNAIRSSMRTDVDILVVGEIRDLETALLVASAVGSGHPVMTTVHASRALGIIPRLEGLGSTMANNPVNRALLCGPQFISGLIHQTLVPVLCGSCSIPFGDALQTGMVDAGLEFRLRAVAGGDLDRVRFRGPGCAQCRKGVRGRTVCAEVVAPDPPLLKLLLDRRDQEAFDLWLGRETGYSIRDHAIDKMCEGLISPVNVERSLGQLRLESHGALRKRGLAA